MIRPLFCVFALLAVPGTVLAADPAKGKAGCTSKCDCGCQETGFCTCGLSAMENVEARLARLEREVDRLCGTKSVKALCPCVLGGKCTCVAGCACGKAHEDSALPKVKATVKKTAKKKAPAKKSAATRRATVTLGEPVLYAAPSYRGVRATANYQFPLQRSVPMPVFNGQGVQPCFGNR